MQEGEVRRLFDPATGHEALVCDDVATFERLRDVLRREAGVGVTVDVPPAPVRSVSLELAEHADPAPVGWGSWLGVWGCVAALVAVGGVFIAGLLTIAGWVRA
jgi:hypothetical protein